MDLRLFWAAIERMPRTEPPYHKIGKRKIMVKLVREGRHTAVLQAELPRPLTRIAVERWNRLPNR